MLTKRNALLYGIIAACMCVILWQSFADHSPQEDKRGWRNAGGHVKHHVPDPVNLPHTDESDVNTELDGEDGGGDSVYETTDQDSTDIYDHQPIGDVPDHVVVDKDMQYAEYDTDYQRKESREAQDGDRNIKSTIRRVYVDNITGTILLDSNNVIRNCITTEMMGTMSDDVLIHPMKAPTDIDTELESMAARESSFQDVFNQRAWGEQWDVKGKELDASGRGATLDWTQEMIATLHIVIDQIKLKTKKDSVSLLDVPCGDMGWMSRFLLTRTDVTYTGMDIVPDLIEHHQEHYKEYPWKFAHIDIVEHALKQPYDLILNRMMLQHLYYGDIFKILERFSNSESKYLLTTTFAQTKTNTELRIGPDNPGRFRYLNLLIPPLSLVPPLCIQRDGPPNVFEGWEHFVALWELPLYQVEQCLDGRPFVTKEKITLYSCGTIT